MAQIAGWIYAADGTAFSLERDPSGTTWLIDEKQERLCPMTLEQFQELEADVVHMVRYPKLDAFLVKAAINSLQSTDQ